MLGLNKNKLNALVPEKYDCQIRTWSMMLRHIKYTVVYLITEINVLENIKLHNVK